MNVRTEIHSKPLIQYASDCYLFFHQPMQLYCASTLAVTAICVLWTMLMIFGFKGEAGWETIYFYLDQYSNKLNEALAFVSESVSSLFS